MSTANLAWTVILLGGLGTFLLRASFFTLPAMDAEGGLMARALKMVPIAVLAVVVMPALTVRGPSLAEPAGQARLIAALVAGVIAWRSHNILATIIGGMATLWALKYALGA